MRPTFFFFFFFLKKKNENIQSVCEKKRAVSLTWRKHARRTCHFRNNFHRFERFKFSASKRTSTPNIDPSVNITFPLASQLEEKEETCVFAKGIYLLR
jgi:hypothetical protein